MTVKEIYRQYLQQLRQIYNANEAAVITDWVFESVAGLPRSYVIKNPVQPIKQETIAQLNLCLASLLRHTPVQYVLNQAWFYKMKLKVNEHVLIPRPETEELVQILIDDCKNEAGKTLAGTKLSILYRSRFSVLDIGTGSGCIAIAVKKSLPGITMHAMDISEGALSVAKENAKDHQAEIIFSQINFLDENSWKDLPDFDCIISNPPYIPLNEKEKLDKNVTDFEPHTALFVPDNRPLLFYEKIAAFGKEHLKSNGKIYVEIHQDFAKETAEVFEQPYCAVIKKDMFGKQRMLVISKIIT